ncbi:MAG: response regulator, partial [Thermicanus sp.]|nr:response regulator [Thermicanus sp.]
MEPIRVLIIEDDPAIAQVNKQFVEKVKGYVVVGIATRYEEVEMLLPLLKPHLILLDIFFPDTNGLQILKEIRSRDAAVDVIMITAAKEVYALLEALSGGVFDYIVKP